MLQANYHPGARLDFDQSFDWYANRDELTATQFSDAVGEAIARIVRNTSTFPYIDQRHQQCLLKRFPFRIIFRKLEDQVLIVAIAHQKRRQNYWRGRK